MSAAEQLRSPGRQCACCVHPRRATINKLLVEGRSYRDVAGRFGLSKSGVERHYSACLPAALATAADIDDTADAATVLEQARDWLTEVRELFEQARDDGDLEVALKATTAAERWLSLVAKVTGELAPQRHQVDVRTLSAAEAATIPAVAALTAAYLEATVAEVGVEAASRIVARLGGGGAPKALPGVGGEGEEGT